MKHIILSLLCIIIFISSGCKMGHSKLTSLEQKESASIWTTGTTFYQGLGIYNLIPVYYMWPRSMLLLFSDKKAL